VSAHPVVCSLEVVQDSGGQEPLILAFAVLATICEMQSLENPTLDCPWQSQTSARAGLDEEERKWEGMARRVAGYDTHGK
jgi:hypothetical protein